ncbi:hypothetical protein FACS1894216_13570 [Synergistales bacterium]|nr:hypothetical protein FACS1894216_13570 [Synergistales bacterium]
MSGRKEADVRIPVDELRRMQKATKNAEATAKQQSERAARLEQSAKNAVNRSRQLEDSLAQAGTRIKQLDCIVNSEISGLHNEIKEVVISQNQRLQEQATSFSSALNNAVNTQNRRMQEQASNLTRRMQEQEDRIYDAMDEQKDEIEGYVVRTAEELRDNMAKQKEELKRGMEKQKLEIQQRMQENQRQITDEINKIDGRIKFIEDTEVRHKELAQYWIDMTIAYISDIGELRHELFAPKELATLKNDITRAQSNLRDNMYQVAADRGQEAFVKALTLLDKVVQEGNEWKVAQEEWERALSETQSDLSDYQDLHFDIETDKGAEHVKADLDSWTDGGLAKVRDELKVLENNMRDLNNKPIDSLMDGIQQLEELRQKMGLVAAVGKENLLMSQWRFQLASDIADIVGETFLMNYYEGEYFGGNRSKAYHGSFKNTDGDEIVVVITPEADAQGIIRNNKVEFDFNVKSTNATEAHEEWTRCIGDSLRENNIPMRKLRCVEGYERRNSDQCQRGDMEKVRAGKVEGCTGRNLSQTQKDDMNKVLAGRVSA